MLFSISLKKCLSNSKDWLNDSVNLFSHSGPFTSPEAKAHAVTLSSENEDCTRGRDLMKPKHVFPLSRLSKNPYYSHRCISPEPIIQ